MLSTLTAEPSKRHFDLRSDNREWIFDVPSILTSNTTIAGSSLLIEPVGGVLALDGCLITLAAIPNAMTQGAALTSFTGRAARYRI
jgi:hypothetical protein